MFEDIWAALPKKTALAAAAGVAFGAAVAFLGVGSAVDTAGSPVTQAQAQELRADGTTLLVQALTWWPRCGAPTTQPSTRVETLRNADSAGLGIAGYVLLDPYSSGAQAVDRARQGIPDDLWAKMKFVAIDFEIPGECWNTGTVIPYGTITDALDELERLGKPKVLYTSYGEWTGHLLPSNPPHPPDTYLWEASWDGNPDVDFNRHPFGGWTTDDIVMEQYDGNQKYAGVFADPDSMSAERFPWEEPAPPAPPVPVCASGDAEWSPGECAHFDGTAWVSPLRTYVPLGKAGLWFGADGHLLAPLGAPATP